MNDELLNLKNLGKTSTQWLHAVCIHSDTPGALELVASTRARLEGAGIRIKAPR